MLAVTATSCIDDSSSYGGNPLPGLSVTVPGDEEMPVYSFNYGEDCVITPDIRYDGTGELSYEWSIGTFNNRVKGPMEFVTNDKTLRYFFPQGGSYYAHLVVSDGEVGLVQDYEININRTFEQGYMILSNNAAGEGNLVFIKDLTREEIEAGESRQSWRTVCSASTPTSAALRLSERRSSSGMPGAAADRCRQADSRL